MLDGEPSPLRVLIANEKRDRLERLAQVVIALGHDVIAREIYVKQVGAVTASTSSRSVGRVALEGESRRVVLVGDTLEAWLKLWIGDRSHRVVEPIRVRSTR